MWDSSRRILGSIVLVVILLFSSSGSRQHEIKQPNKTLQEQIREAAWAKVPWNRIQEYISKRPTIDTTTPQGRLNYHRAAFVLSVKETDFLADCAPIMYWVISSTETRVHVAGIAWDQKGQPYYFTAPLIP